MSYIQQRDEWLAEHPDATAKEAWDAGYRTSYIHPGNRWFYNRYHVMPYFRKKGFLLCEITKNNLQDYINEKKEGYEYFNDVYLYEHAAKESLNEAYTDVFALKDEPRFKYVQKNPIRRFLQNVFGVVLYYDENEKKRREQEVKDANLRNLEDVIEGKVYPGRLSAIEKNEKISSKHAQKCNF